MLGIVFEDCERYKSIAKTAKRGIFEDAAACS